MVEAIAVETGYTNSPAASATYTINAVLPAPIFSPTPGAYSSSQTVTISDATAGTTIYYTADGSTPTTSSTKYTGAITVSATETLEAIAVETGYTNSAAASAAYTINAVLPAPIFSPTPGTYSSSQTVTISDATAGTTIYYTTDGTTPTTSSIRYAGAITVSATETLEATAVEEGYATSAVSTAVYNLPAGFTIQLSPNSLALALGQTATSTVTINQVEGLDQAVVFGCAGLPAELSCSFSPTAVDSGGTSTSTTLIVASNRNVATDRGTTPLVPISIAALGICAIGFPRRRKVDFPIFIAGLALGLTGTSGCGGSQVTLLTSPVTSTITVTATAGTLQRTAPLSVTVK